MNHGKDKSNEAANTNLSEEDFDENGFIKPKSVTSIITPENDGFLSSNSVSTTEQQNLFVFRDETQRVKFLNSVILLSNKLQNPNFKNMLEYILTPRSGYYESLTETKRAHKKIEELWRLLALLRQELLKIYQSYQGSQKEQFNKTLEDLKKFRDFCAGDVGFIKTEEGRKDNFNIQQLLQALPYTILKLNTLIATINNSILASNPTNITSLPVKPTTRPPVSSAALIMQFSNTMKLTNTEEPSLSISTSPHLETPKNVDEKKFGV